MKAFICLLVLATSANAGILLGALSGGFGGYSYGGEYDQGHGHGQEPSIIRVIHVQSSGYSDHHSHHDSGPAIIEVVHEEGHSSGFDHHHHHVEVAPQVVEVIHEDHGYFAPAPVVQHVQVIHEQVGGDSVGFEHGGWFSSGGGYSYGGGHDHGQGVAQAVKIIKVIQQDQGHHHHESHGWV